MYELWRGITLFIYFIIIYNYQLDIHLWYIGIHLNSAYRESIRINVYGSDSAMCIFEISCYGEIHIITSTCYKYYFGKIIKIMCKDRMCNKICLWMVTEGCYLFK